MRLTFYVNTGHDAEHCGTSLHSGNPIRIDGEDPLTGRTKPYEGVVLAVENMTAEGFDERWRVAMEIAPRQAGARGGFTRSPGWPAGQTAPER